MANLQECKRSKDAIGKGAEELFNQMFLAHAIELYDNFRKILESVFEADSSSISYLKTFSEVLTMSISHVEYFYERVNVKHKQTRLLKRALDEIIDKAESSILECSDFSDRPRTGQAYSPLNINFLGSSNNEESTHKKRQTNPRSPELFADDMNQFTSTSSDNLCINEQPNVRKDLRSALRDVIQRNDHRTEPVSNLPPCMNNGVYTFDTARKPIHVGHATAPGFVAPPSSHGVVGSTITESHSTSLASNESTIPGPSYQRYHPQTMSENSLNIPTDSGSSAHKDVDDPEQNMLGHQKQNTGGSLTALSAGMGSLIDFASVALLGRMAVDD